MPSPLLTTADAGRRRCLRAGLVLGAGPGAWGLTACQARDVATPATPAPPDQAVAVDEDYFGGIRWILLQFAETRATESLQSLAGHRGLVDAVLYRLPEAVTWKQVKAHYLSSAPATGHTLKSDDDDVSSWTHTLLFTSSAAGERPFAVVWSDDAKNGAGLLLTLHMGPPRSRVASLGWRMGWHGADAQVQAGMETLMLNDLQAILQVLMVKRATRDGSSLAAYLRAALAAGEVDCIGLMVARLLMGPTLQDSPVPYAEVTQVAGDGQPRALHAEAAGYFGGALAVALTSASDGADQVDPILRAAAQAIQAAQPAAARKRRPQDFDPQGLPWSLGSTLSQSRQETPSFRVEGAFSLLVADKKLPNGEWRVIGTGGPSSRGGFISTFYRVTACI